VDGVVVVPWNQPDPFVRMFAWTYAVVVAATFLLILRRRWLRARRREHLTL
jgi:hypothetical protein